MGLTDLQIKKLKTRGRRYEIADGKGLILRVRPSGGKSWFYRYTFNGEPRIVTLGEYPGISLSEARNRHSEARKKVQQGVDPGVEAKESRAKRKAAPTFQDLLDEFYERELSATPSGDERKRLIEKDVIPVWRKKKVATITRRDAVLVIDKVRDRAPVTANRVQGVLVRMFNFASERGLIDFSPLVGMRRTKETSRSRVLTDAEIKSFWACMDLDREDIDIYRLTKLALKAVLLTGQRPGEVAGMLKNEIDGEWWIIPPERSKNREENRVPILPMFAEIIELAGSYNAGSAFVFVSPRSPLYQFKKPAIAKPFAADLSVSVGAMANAIRRHSAEMEIPERFTPHDLRRTLRTKLAELGVSDVIAERVLNHKLQGVLGIYNRHSYDIEKRQALALWEQRLGEIIEKSQSTSNVIPFGGVRHA